MVLMLARKFIRIIFLTVHIACVLPAKHAISAIPPLNPDSSATPQTAGTFPGSSKDGFRAMLFFTEDLDFQKKFHEGGNINLKATSVVRKNIPFLVTISFAGPGVTGNGYAKVVIDLKITRPDGITYFEAKDVPGWDGIYKYSQRSMQLADAVIKMTIEPSDPLGKYNVNATVRDTVRGVSLVLEKEFDAK